MNINLGHPQSKTVIPSNEPENVLIENLANEIAKELSANVMGDPSKSLLPVPIQRERLKIEIAATLEKHFHSLASGVSSLLTSLQELLKDEEIYGNILLKMSDKKIHELSDEEITALFSSAVNLYNHQSPEIAADAFYALTAFDKGQAQFWTYLGNARFHAHQFKEAIDAYMTALKLNEVYPECRIYLACCQEKENKISEAIDSLLTAREIVVKNNQFFNLINLIDALLEELKNKH